MWKELKPAILLTIVLTILTGIAYPLAMTGSLQLIFPRQANGSLVEQNGKIVGSELIAQPFTRPGYFHPRPSATSPNPWDPMASGGSNLGPTNPALSARLTNAANDFRKENPNFSGPIPADALTTSGSGLDPHISPANAKAQAARVAKARGVSPDAILAMVQQHIEGRTFGILGEPRVNVLRLNIDLDRQFAKH